MFQCYLIFENFCRLVQQFLFMVSRGANKIKISELSFFLYKNNSTEATFLFISLGSRVKSKLARNVNYLTDLLGLVKISPRRCTHITTSCKPCIEPEFLVFYLATVGHESELRSLWVRHWQAYRSDLCPTRERLQV